MALTATANHVTIDDIKKRLQLQHCIFLKSSFNRKNLNYIITSKRPSAIVLDIIKFIKEKYQYKTGLIYCLARKTCEKVAKKLREGGLIARHYHAGMSAEEKDIALNEWRIGRCNVIVATVRSVPLIERLTKSHFHRSLSGWELTNRMVRVLFEVQQSECNFSDSTVRFVIHHDLPKSLDG